MSRADPLDVLIVSLGSTTGLRTADEGLAESLRRAGASVEIARAKPPREVRTLMLTDLQWARAARAATDGFLTDPDSSSPRAIIYSSTTAALLWRRPGAIRFDAPAAGNRPGRHGLWQRPIESSRLRQAPLLLPLSRGALGELPTSVQVDDRRVLVLGLPVEPSGPTGGERDIAAITYAANPLKKGLDRVLDAWRRVTAGADSVEQLELVVAGASAEELRRAGISFEGERGVRLVGSLPAVEYRALLRRSRCFVCAPRREDHGAAQLEALADGCLLVTTPAPGPYAALGIAGELDPRLVDDDLSRALSSALLDPPPVEGYRARASAALADLSPQAIDRRIAAELLPRLLSPPA
jgi:glycosyltransferase involved in cell wall biosynthesis